jgi:hypothetical protein
VDDADRDDSRELLGTRRARPAPAELGQPAGHTRTPTTDEEAR